MKLPGFLQRGKKVKRRISSIKLGQVFGDDEINPYLCSIYFDTPIITRKGGENGFETWASIHCLYAAKAVPMNGAPSSNADKLHFEDLPENCRLNGDIKLLSHKIHPARKQQSVV